ncbi:GTPase Era [Tumebacillus permanentifrigoris]|jgi:GTPase|uniref:GTPase Era n=1 Tax=Tumebacillus permanentifrigoris TaxID=378543 RepID=A0A316D5C9_9BACL|nr:GTPase Era [Tumebacillus permanentifrigoris]PWK08410.1 GTP-binding protein Era [Tumebacillus permanentifrigoris]
MSQSTKQTDNTTSQQTHSGFVAIIGRPNVGKSTLMNFMIGQKVAIMSDKPQTTRNRIHGVLTREEGQIIFMDTPGIHKPKHKLGEQMVRTAIDTLNGVEAVLFIVDATMPKGAGDEYIIEILKKVKDTPVYLLINKVDIVEKNTLLGIISSYKDDYPFAEIIPISAKTGDNVDRLVDNLMDRLPEGPYYYPPDMVTDHPERFIIAELIREKCLHHTREEVPHSIAVEIERMQFREEKDMLVVYAAIYTERETQKAIIIGKQGALLKKIGQLARHDIERLMGSKVYLELWVKVKEDWRNREHMLRNFGFSEE